MNAIDRRFNADLLPAGGIEGTDILQRPGRYDPKAHEHPFVSEYHGLNVDDLDQALNAIVEGKKIAAHFRCALDEKICVHAVAKLKDHHLKKYYETARTIGRIGDSLYENQFSDEAAAEYWRQAKVNRREVRRVFQPYGSPIDQLQTLCDEAPSFKGASTLRVGDNIAFKGLVRYLDSGAEILPHTDEARYDMPASMECQLIDCQIAANFYPAMPAVGGELTVYKQRVTKLEYDAHRRPEPDSYALVEKVLSPVNVTIRPDVGDLVLFNAGFPHRVAATNGDTRFSISTFLGITRDRFIRVFS